MTRVYKYELPFVGTLKGSDDFVTLQMPVGARVLCVQMQAGRPCLWARVSPDASLETRTFRWAGTGHDLDERTTGRYIGTWQDGPYVWHLFDEVGR